MIDSQTILAIIPARGQSKQVPRKNIRAVNGKPLIAWTIEAARKSAYIDRLILSSEDAEIIRVAEKLGCEVPFVRPSELAADDTPGILPVLHAIENMPRKYDLVMLLQPTSPLRTTEDIDGCLAFFAQTTAPACVSVVRADKSPYWHYRVTGNDHLLQPLLPADLGDRPRQLLPETVLLNGAIYLARTPWLMKTRTFVTEQTSAYRMPKERSIDIDSELDFALLASLLKKPEQQNASG
ncbi:MAG: acylneuraminate cytidylyltransferase [Desulfatitalea sp. BRH_c12]|nr:MAG: acylneuraminate cytidylyltransferase [Desulfatitalea sp. BRH_c12]